MLEFLNYKLEQLLDKGCKIEQTHNKIILILPDNKRIFAYYKGKNLTPAYQSILMEYANKYDRNLLYGFM
jgi:hypothetical protein